MIFKASRFLLLAILLFCCKSQATTDGASVTCIYFHKSTATGNPRDNFYSSNWAKWLKVYRAIEKKPDLQKSLLKLPKDSFEGRKGAIGLIHKNLSNSSIWQQSNHVYVLQLGIYDSRKGVDRFLRIHAPKIVLRKGFVA